MREIKFRAYLKNEEKMVDVKSIHFGTKKIIYSYSKGKQCYGNKSCNFQDCIVMQSTGHEDKNGKKIYDGDIVKVNSVANAFIEYDNERMSFMLNWGKLGMPNCVTLSDDKSIEVIGNVFENKDLLIGGK